MMSTTIYQFFQSNILEVIDEVFGDIPSLDSVMQLLTEEGNTFSEELLEDDYYFTESDGSDLDFVMF